MPTSLLSPRLYAPATKPPWGSRIDPAHPLTRQLIGAWALNEGGGALVNAVNGSISPLQTGQTRGITPIMPGLHSNAATAITLVHAPLNPAAGALVFLVNFEVNVATSQISNLLVAPSDGFFIVADGYTHEVRVGVYQGSGNSNAFLYSNLHPTINTLYHIVSTYSWNGSSYDLTCFVNGQPSASGSAGTVQFASGTTSHGLMAVSSGCIPDTYDVKIYNRVLTAAEVAWLYNEPWAMFRQDKRQFWMSAGTSSATIYTKNFTVSESGGLTVIKKIGKFSSISAPSIYTAHNNITPTAKLATEGSSSIAIKNITPTAKSTTEGSSVSKQLNVGKPLSVSEGSSSSLRNLIGLFRSVAEVSSSSVVKQIILVAKSVTEASTASTIKDILTTKSTTSSTSSNLGSFNIGKAFSVTEGYSLSMLRTIAKHISTLSSTTIVSTNHMAKTLSASASSVASVIYGFFYNKSFVVSESSLTSMVKIIGIVRTVPESLSVSMIRSIVLGAKSVVEASSPSTIKNILLTKSTSNLAVAARGIFLISKFLSLTESSSPTLVRNVLKTFTIVGSSSVSYVKNIQRMYTILISSSTLEQLARVINLLITSSTTTSIQKSIVKYFTTSVGNAVLVLYLIITKIGKVIIISRDALVGRIIIQDSLVGQAIIRDEEV